jgi:hypothetical protein
MAGLRRAYPTFRNFSLSSNYLKEQPDSDRARQQIQTDVRETARRQLGWTDADLSSVLF